MNQEVERQALSVYLVDPTGGETYFAAATGKFDPRSWATRIRGLTVEDLVAHKEIEIGSHTPESFSPFDVSSVAEEAPHKATIFYENGLQHTVELLGDGTTYHHLTIPKEVKIEGNQITLLLPVRLDPIEASRFNVFGVVIPRLVRGPSVDIYLPQEIDNNHFLAFTTRGKKERTLGVLTSGAEKVTLIAVPHQPHPTKDYYLVFQIPPAEKREENGYKIDFLTLAKEGKPLSILESLFEAEKSLEDLEKEAENTWKERLDQLVQVSVETESGPLKDLVEAFEKNKITLAKMHQVIRKTPREILRALIAGPKWPNQIFCRDAMINILAALAVGLRNEAEETLTTFFAFQKKALSQLDGLLAHWKALVRWEFVVPEGKASHRTDRTGTNYTSMDSTALMVSAIADYVRNTGNINFLNRNRDVLDLAVGALKAMIGDGEWKLPQAAFTFHRFGPFHISQGWKDEASRWGAPIEVAAQFWQAFNDAVGLYKLMGDEERATNAKEMADIVKDAVLKLKKDGLYPDVVGLSGRPSFKNTPEAIWPYLVGLDNWDELDEETRTAIIERLVSIEGLWVKNVGIRAAQLGEKTLLGRIFEQFVASIQGKKEAYHGAKSIWPKSTGEAASFLFQIGEEERGLKLLTYLAKQTGLATYGGIPETLRADGTVSDQCPIQAWSSGIYLEVFYRHLLGIDIDMLSTQPTLTIMPANLPSLFEGSFTLQVENIKIGDAYYVKVEYTKERITVTRTDKQEGTIGVRSKGEQIKILEKGENISLAYQ